MLINYKFVFRNILYLTDCDAAAQGRLLKLRLWSEEMVSCTYAIQSTFNTAAESRAYNMPRQCTETYVLMDARRAPCTNVQWFFVTLHTL